MQVFMLLILDHLLGIKIKLVKVVDDYTFWHVLYCPVLQQCVLLLFFTFHLDA